MTSLFNCLPIIALVSGYSMAQIEGTASLTTLGPVGIICAWLIWRDERQMRQTVKIHEGVRDDNSKLREEFRGYVHELKGLNRNLLYQAAIHGPTGIREVAAKELERKNAQQG